LESAWEVIKHSPALAELLPEELERIERAFMARQLVQCTLPHSNPGPVAAWWRTNGQLTLSIKPGRDKHGKSFGYPYGSIPRLLLFWIVTEAKRTGERRLELGDTLADFMRQIGLNPDTGSGKRSDARRLRDQMHRLFRATISFEQSFGRGEQWLDMQVAPQGQLWWDSRDPEQKTFFGSWIRLSEEFFLAITAAVVPVRLEALRKLKRSPLALDLYALAAYKVHQAIQYGRAQAVPWKGLAKQLGAEYDPKRMNNFRSKIKKTMSRIGREFPEMRLSYSLTGITFLPESKPAVPPRISTAGLWKKQARGMKR
jgi:hypothetical protein